MWNSENQVYTVLRAPVSVLKGSLKLNVAAAEKEIPRAVCGNPPSGCLI